MDCARQASLAGFEGLGQSTVKVANLSYVELGFGVTLTIDASRLAGT